MGNTCASIHIAWRGNVDDAAKAISRSYRKLGYERVKKAPVEGGKHVVVLAPPGNLTYPFMTATTPSSTAAS